MFKNIFKKKPKEPTEFVIATLYKKIMPLDRGEFIEDPLEEFLLSKNYGATSGGGTSMTVEGEIEYIDIEIVLYTVTDDILLEIKEFLEKLGVPKGSKLTVEATDQVIQIGNLEGLGLYLNGTDLDDEVYANSDSNFVLSECEKALSEKGEFVNHWQGPKETALYFYGESFETMKESIAPFINEYPLCQKCRVVQIA